MTDLRKRTSFERKLPNDPNVIIEGGEENKEYEHSESPVEGLTQLDRPRKVAEEEYSPDTMPNSLSFADAFRTARKRKLTAFTWRGKNYSTKVK